MWLGIYHKNTKKKNMIIIIVRKLAKKIKKHSFGKRMGFSLGIWKKKVLE